MRDDFRLLAKFYDLLIKPKKEISWLSTICESKNKLILDVGGGTGRIAEVLKMNGCEVIIYDPSIHMLRSEKNNNLGFLRVCGEVESITFNENQFDNVIMVDTLHHVKDQKIAVQSIQKILKPGGIFLLEEPDIRKFSVKLIAILEKLMFMRSKFLYPDEIFKLFIKQNFTIKMIEEDYNLYFIVQKGN